MFAPTTGVGLPFLHGSCHCSLTGNYLFILMMIILQRLQMHMELSYVIG